MRPIPLHARPARCPRLGPGAAAVGARRRGAVRTKYVEPVYPRRPPEDRAAGQRPAGRADRRPGPARATSRSLAASQNDFVAAGLRRRQAVAVPARDAGWQADRDLRQRRRALPDPERQAGPDRGAHPRRPRDLARRRVGQARPRPRASRSGAARIPPCAPTSLLDVPPRQAARTLAVTRGGGVAAGRKFPIFQPPVAVPAGATEVRIPVVAQIGKDWEDGVWIAAVHRQRRARRRWTVLARGGPGALPLRDSRIVSAASRGALGAAAALRPRRCTPAARRLRRLSAVPAVRRVSRLPRLLALAAGHAARRPTSRARLGGRRRRRDRRRPRRRRPRRAARHHGGSAARALRRGLPPAGRGSRPGRSRVIPWRCASRDHAADRPRPDRDRASRPYDSCAPSSPAASRARRAGSSPAASTA